MKNYLKLSLLLIFTLGLISLFSGCERHQRRPYVYLRVGKIHDFKQQETYLPDLRLVIFKDEKGFSAMSTDCTYDLTPLKRIEEGGVVLYSSTYTTSQYTRDGEVKQGPTKFPLPRYKLEYASTLYGGVFDSLYVFIGDEVSKDWRLGFRETK